MALVQSKFVSATSATASVTFTAAPTAGNYLSIALTSDGDSGGPAAPTGWTKTTPIIATGGPYVTWYHKKAGASESATFSVTLSASVLHALFAYEDSGVASLEVTGSAQVSTNSATLATSVAAVTTGQTARVVIAPSGINASYSFDQGYGTATMADRFGTATLTGTHGAVTVTATSGTARRLAAQFVKLIPPANRVAPVTGVGKITVAGSVVLPPSLVSDTFNRADSSTGLGTSSSGHAWSALHATLGISANKAYSPGTLDRGGVLSTTQANVTVEADVTLSGTRAYVGLVGRALDTSNQLLVILDVTSTRNFCTLAKYDAGVFTELTFANTTLTLGSTYRLVLRMDGGAISVLIGGTTVLSFTLSSADQTKFGAYTKHGLYLYSGTSSFDDRASRWDNFAVKSLTTAADTTAPVVASRTVTGTSLVIAYDESLDSASVPATSAFACVVNGAARNVTTVAINGKAVTLTLSSAVASTDTVTLAYTAPATNPIQDAAGNDAASYTAAAVRIRPLLKWAPPTGWESYTTYTIPSTGGTIDLDPNTNYKLVQTAARTDALHIRGGRNVVWVGGRISINNKPATAVGTERRALVISDVYDINGVNLCKPGRIFHLEGILCDGNDLSEGFNQNCPTAVIQIENCRVEPAKLRGFDDRDGTGAYSAASHPDLIQPWGGADEIRVDGFTGRSTYQGIFLLSPVPDWPVIQLRRVNLEMVEVAAVDDPRSYAGQRGYVWGKEESGRQFLDNGTVWLKHHINNGWAGGGPFKRVAYRDATGKVVEDPVPGNATFVDSLSPHSTDPAPYQAIVASDALGTYAYWPETATVNADPSGPAVSNLSGPGPGRIYSGLPPGGDYVLATDIGLAYVSPGYETPAVVQGITYGVPTTAQTPGTTASSVSVPDPAVNEPTINASTLLELVVSCRGSSTVTTPTGWSLVRGASDVTTGTANANVRLTVFRRFGNPGAFSVAFSSATRANVSVTPCFGVDTTTPYDVDSVSLIDTSIDTTRSGAGITTATAGAELHVAWASEAGTGATITAPASMTQRVAATTEIRPHLLASEPRPTAGATGTRSATANTSEASVAITMALRPATVSSRTGVAVVAGGSRLLLSVRKLVRRAPLVSGSGTIRAMTRKTGRRAVTVASPGRVVLISGRGAILIGRADVDAAGYVSTTGRRTGLGTVLVHGLGASTSSGRRFQSVGRSVFVSGIGSIKVRKRKTARKTVLVSAAGVVQIDVTPPIQPGPAASVLAKLQLIPSDARSPLSPVSGTEVRVHLGVVHDDGSVELTDVGVFGIESVGVAEANGGVRIDVRGFDRSIKIQRDKFRAPYIVQPGTNYVEAIKALVRRSLPGTVFRDESTTHNTPLLQWEFGDDPLQAIKEMADSIGFEVFFAGDGAFVIRSGAVSVNDPVWEFIEGPGTVIDSLGRSLTREGVFNGVVQRGESRMSENPPVQAEAWDTDPSSPTYYDPAFPERSSFGAVPVFEVSEYIGTVEQAADAAMARLRSLRGLSEQNEITARSVPGLEGGDVVHVQRGRLSINAAHIIERLTLPLKAGLMSVKTRERRL